MSNLNVQKPLNIVAVSGGLNNPSKTEALVQAIIDELGDATPINVRLSLSLAKLAIYWVVQFTATNCHNVYKMT